MRNVISVSIHHNNIPALATEMYKVANKVFKQTIPIIISVHSVYNGTESASYFRPKIWEQIPSEIQNKKFLVGFKREIKKRKPTECPIV